MIKEIAENMLHFGRNMLPKEVEPPSPEGEGFLFHRLKQS